MLRTKANKKTLLAYASLAPLLPAFKALWWLLSCIGNIQVLNDTWQYASNQLPLLKEFVLKIHFTLNLVLEILFVIGLISFTIFCLSHIFNFFRKIGVKIVVLMDRMFDPKKLIKYQEALEKLYKSDLYTVLVEDTGFNSTNVFSLSGLTTKSEPKSGRRELVRINLKSRINKSLRDGYLKSYDKDNNEVPFYAPTANEFFIRELDFYNWVEEKTLEISNSKI